MKKSLYSALVVLLLASATATAGPRNKRPIKLPPPLPSTSSVVAPSLSTAFWFSLFTGMVL